MIDIKSNNPHLIGGKIISRYDKIYKNDLKKINARI